jgi:hypothetical protein
MKEEIGERERGETGCKLIIDLDIRIKNIYVRDKWTILILCERQVKCRQALTMIQ